MLEQEEVDRERSKAQLDLLQGFLKSREQTVINIALGAVGVIALAGGFLEPTLSVKIGIVVLVFSVLSLFWYIDFTNKEAIKNSQSVLVKILGESFGREIDKIANGGSWLRRNSIEIALTVFSVIAIYFLALLFKESFVKARFNNFRTIEPSVGCHERFEFFRKR